MNTIIIRTEEQRAHACRVIAGLDLAKPWDVTIEPHKKRRTNDQNRLQRLLVKSISEQLGDRTPEEVRGECKLTLGVPILRASNEGFREKYDAIVRPLFYEQKLALMMEPLDLPVTRLMTTKQHADYLDSIYRHYSAQGLRLPVPEDMNI